MSRSVPYTVSLVLDARVTYLCVVTLRRQERRGWETHRCTAEGATGRLRPGGEVGASLAACADGWSGRGNLSEAAFGAARPVVRD